MIEIRMEKFMHESQLFEMLPNPSPPVKKISCNPHTSLLHFNSLTEEEILVTYLVLLRAKTLEIAPRSLVHGVRVTEIGCGLVVLLRSQGILLHPPAVAETVGKLKDCQDELPFRSPAFLHARLEG